MEREAKIQAKRRRKKRETEKILNYLFVYDFDKQLTLFFAFGHTDHPIKN